MNAQILIIMRGGIIGVDTLIKFANLSFSSYHFQSRQLEGPVYQKERRKKHTFNEKEKKFETAVDHLEE